MRERVLAGQRRERSRIAFERGIARVIVGKTAAEAQRRERRAVGGREIAGERREPLGQHERVGLRRVRMNECGPENTCSPATGKPAAASVRTASCASFGVIPKWSCQRARIVAGQRAGIHAQQHGARRAAAGAASRASGTKRATASIVEHEMAARREPARMNISSIDGLFR